MYATIPEDEAKQPKNQAPVRGSYGLVVAVCVGVIIGTLGTIAFIGGPEAPSPSRAAMELDEALVEDCKAARESWERDRESWKLYCGIVLEDK